MKLVGFILEFRRDCNMPDSNCVRDIKAEDGLRDNLISRGARRTRWSQLIGSFMKVSHQY